MSSRYPHSKLKADKLLERLDVVNSKIAEEAIKAFFEFRPEVLDSFHFNGIFLNQHSLI